MKSAMTSHVVLPTILCDSLNPAPIARADRALDASRANSQHEENPAFYSGPLFAMTWLVFWPLIIL